MTAVVKEITQIALEVLEAGERLHEVIIHQPIKKDRVKYLNASDPRWALPFSMRFKKHLLSLLFRLFPALIPENKRASEAKFKTLVAYLLAHEEIAALLVGTPKRQHAFALALQRSADRFGFTLDWPDQFEEGEQLAKRVQEMAGENRLFDSPSTLYQELAAIKPEEKREFFEALLAELKIPEFSSNLAVTTDASESISVASSTHRYKIAVSELAGSGEILFAEETRASSLKNLRRVVDDSSSFSTSYSEAISTPLQILEILLTLFPERSSMRFFLDSDQKVSDGELAILSTSLLGWQNLSEILEEKRSAELLDGKILEIREEGKPTKRMRLSIVYLNIAPENVWGHFKPEETWAEMQDIFDLGLLRLYFRALKRLKIAYHFHDLEEGLARMDQEKDFFFRQREALQLIDLFRKEKKELMAILSSKKGEREGLVDCFEMLFFQKLSEKECFLALSLIAKALDMHLHTSELMVRTDSISSKSTLHKAESAFCQIQGHSTLFCQNEKERDLFELLFKLYYEWEESTHRLEDALR